MKNFAASYTLTETGLYKTLDDNIILDVFTLDGDEELCAEVYVASDNDEEDRKVYTSDGDFWNLRDTNLIIVRKCTEEFFLDKSDAYVEKKLTYKELVAKIKEYCIDKNLQDVLKIIEER